MTEKEKAKAYDKAIERAIKHRNHDGLTLEQYETIDIIFPELKEKESENERIRKEIIELLRNWASLHYISKEQFSERMAWLEKQGEQKPCMVQWKGDNLKEVIGFTGKDKNFEKWFKSFEEYEKYVHEHNDIFKLFNENGSHYEIPVGAWIVKTPDGYNIASNAVLKQKSADKIETTFNVGDWVVFIKSKSVYQVEKKENYEYTLRHILGGSLCLSFSDENLIREWTIKDAKDGDVLACNEEILLFKSYSVLQGRISLYCWYNGHTNNFHSKEVIDILMTTTNKIYPATKEQRDTLMKAMNDAGYEWDVEKKELRKNVRVQ